MARWIRFVLAAVVAMTCSFVATTEVHAGTQVYDAPASARVEVHKFDTTDSSPLQLVGAQEGSATPTAKAGGTSTTFPSRSVATKAACSFSGGTYVLMADGTRKRIDEVEVGDMVVATDPETGETKAREVVATLPHEDQLVTLGTDVGQIVTTEDHRYWNVTDGEWQEAQDLDLGDQLLTASGEPVAVEGLDWSTLHTTTAYDLDVQGIDTFYIDAGIEDVLVHNCEIADALAYATRAEKLDHIFVPKHKLDPLLNQFGSREAVVEQMLTGVKGLTPAAGTFEIPVVISGQTVVVRGAVVDGVVKLGTAFTP